jgi:L-threonylcarbamoyladenylate synthase
MNTEIVRVNPNGMDSAAIRRAAELIRAGHLVAFPTETVYGLGANALEAQAVRGIFKAKGRPAFNPLIVHVPEATHVLNVVKEWSETADRLARQFWPGPLTIVAPRRSEVPDEVTAGGPTVAVRCPDHPIAQALLRAAGVPIAAPSANRSTELSPTRAEHVLAGLDGRINLILDGGPCPGGIESTVVDASSDVVRLLRPGLITVPMLEEVVGKLGEGGESVGPARSPGQMAKHYSPRTPLILIEGNQFLDDVIEMMSFGKYHRVGELHFSGKAVRDSGTRKSARFIDLSDDPYRAGAHLYDELHLLDQEGLDAIFVEMPPDTPEWAAIRDRLTRAAAR